jgi:quercetin 2,3-dioxygenase
MSKRCVIETTRSQPVMEGAGVHLHRAFGFQGTALYDPFLLLDDFRGDTPEQYLAGFPWHPHRGIETITYMLEGSVEHGDSMGNRGTVRAGEVQWMTAGRGIIHQEMPKPGPGGRMGGFQLWANLPAAHKMIAPRYQEFAAADFPHVELAGGGTAIVVCGTLADQQGPVTDVTIAPLFLDVAVPPGATVELPTPEHHTAMAYVYEGAGFFDASRETALDNRTLVRFGPGSSAAITATDARTLRFLFIAGKPLKEPIAWGGPIVMNTREELALAFRQLEDKTFLHPPNAPA